MLRRIIIWFIEKYKRFISPYLGNICRFYPSCSDYCIESIYSFGIIKGIWKSFKRILRCNPFCSGGYDPVHRKDYK